MPSLIWPGKHTTEPESGRLIQDSIIFPGGTGYPSQIPENRLIFGDNLPVMAALMPEYAGRINLIYADPPFFTNRKYAARIGRGEDSRHPEGWALAEGYPDSWTNLDAYLGFLYERFRLFHRLLAPDGTLYLHLDWHANSYARLLLDEIFGPDHLLNEIVWTYHGPSPIRTAFNRKHDTILAYVKGEQYTFNADAVRQPYNPSTVQTFKASRKAGFGKVPDLARGKVPEDWWYFPVVARLHSERTGYPTQKPESLLQRIILASSNPGDLVADFFCGSGTAPFTAARLGRKFLAVDGAFRAIHTTRARLCALPAPAFALERETACCFPLLEKSKLRIQVGPESIKVTGDASLDYWEVDPSWDGITFKSAAQAQRPVRSADIAHEIRIKTGRKVCVRLVTVEGKMFQRGLNV
jgi:site-specific DNA-methyltransferase (adenine-specific)